MSMKINKNGKEYPVGVIPQNVIDDVTEMYNGASSPLSLNSTYVSAVAGCYNKYSRVGKMHNLSGIITASQSIPSQTTLVYAPTSYMPDDIVTGIAYGSDGNIYPIGWHKTMGLYSDNVIASGITLRFNISWFK